MVGRSLLVACALVLGLPQMAAAQAFPSKTIRIIVGQAPGSGSDVIARRLADGLSKLADQPVIVENRAGAGGNIGTDVVVKSPPDGATIGVSILGPLAMNTVLMKSMPYDPFKDIALISMLTLQPSVLAVSNQLGAGDLAQLFAILKKDPGKYNYASIGRGSLSHLAMALIASRSGTEVVHAPFTSSPQAALAVVQNEVQMTVLPAISVMPLARDGKMKALAQTSARRSPVLPDMPTFAEAGVEGVEASAWNAMIASVRTPPEMLAQMHARLDAALRDPEVVRRFAEQMMEAAPMSPADTRRYVDEEFARWSAVVKAAGIEPQ